MNDHGQATPKGAMMKTGWRGKVALALALPLLVAVCWMTLWRFAHAEETVARRVLNNPYAGVDWDTFERHRTCLHIHTTESDGDLTPAATIKKYLEAGYTILSIADHDTLGASAPTWPWEKYDIDTEGHRVLPIQGNEISRRIHIGSYFINYGNPDIESADQALEEIGELGGTSVLFHPGRYSVGPTWYIERFRRFDHAVGLEVYNKMDRYPQDRVVYDIILSELMPERPVWAFANDDFHRRAHFGGSFTIFLLPPDGFDEATFRRAMETGQFLALHDPSRDASQMILPERVIVTDQSIRIETEADPSAVAWISHGFEVHRGKELPLTMNLGGYVRAEIEGVGETRTLLQPFALSGKESLQTATLVVENGEGSGEYILGARNVPIVAGDGPDGLVFDRWSGDIEQVADPEARSTTIRLNRREPTRVVPTYREAVAYPLVVKGGTGDADVPEESTHQIAATPPAGKVFDFWSGDVDVLGSRWSPVTEVRMPGRAVSVQAHFTDPFPNHPGLKNPTFADGLEGWQAKPDDVRLEEDEQGAYLVINPRRGIMHRLDEVKIKPGDRITMYLEARIISEGDALARAGFQLLDRHNQELGSSHAPIQSKEWMPYAASALVEEQMETPNIWVWMHGGGEVAIRNFVIRVQEGADDFSE